LPLVSVVLQPMAFLSALDPPRTGDFWMMARAPVGRLGAAWNRCVYAMYRQVLQNLYGRAIDQVRADHGLRAYGGRRMFDASGTAEITLGCYSPHTLLRRAPHNAKLVGFQYSTVKAAPESDLDPALSAFFRPGRRRSFLL
jgi:hypothetical protein